MSLPPAPVAPVAPVVSVASCAVSIPSHRRAAWLALGLLLASGALLLLGMSVGSTGFDSVLAMRHDAQALQIVSQIRLPRTLGAWLAGALLGLAGAVAQGLIKPANAFGQRRQQADDARRALRKTDTDPAVIHQLQGMGRQQCSQAQQPQSDEFFHGVPMACLSASAANRRPSR